MAGTYHAKNKLSKHLQYILEHEKIPIVMYSVMSCILGIHFWPSSSLYFGIDL